MGLIKYMNSCAVEVLVTAIGRFAELGACEAQVFDSSSVQAAIGGKVVYIKVNRNENTVKVLDDYVELLQ